MYVCKTKQKYGGGGGGREKGKEKCNTFLLQWRQKEINENIFTPVVLTFI